tara:strand:+ start:439 stop:1305 length:867 start_codon:yes stop_codon:yes gene_type:complete
MSLIRPGQLRKIVSCSVEFGPSEIYPGNVVEMTINTKMKDSSVINSNESNVTINFADYIFELEGGAVVHEKTRTKMLIKIADDAYDDPFVNLTIRLRRKKSIQWQRKLPILYDVRQKVVFRGSNGYDPRANSANGYKKIPISKRINLEFIDNTQTLTNNSDPAIVGGDGPDLDVYISIVPSKERGKFLKVEIRSEDGILLEKYLKVGVGWIEIQTQGGKGGISKYGGKGGKGGDVTVFITKEARPYFDQIFIENFGGEGGELWRPRIDGQQQGPFGDNGEVTILYWEK